jgi:hypothetical protein
MELLDWRVEWRAFRAVTSVWSVAMAAWRAWDCETRDCAAESDCAAWLFRVSARVCETAWSRASFSGFGGMGGAGPVGVNDGSSSSKGDVRRSWVSFFGAGTGSGV